MSGSGNGRIDAKRLGIVAGVAAVTSVLVGCGSPEQRAQQYYDNGMALIAKNDDLGARLELLKAVKFSSDKVEVWRALAGVDERTKAGNALFGDLRRIVELDPNDLDARLKMVRMMLAGGAADAGLKLLDTAHEGDKPSASFHAVRAQLLLRTNDIAGGLREAQRAVDIDPSNVDALLILASKRLSDGDPDGALKLIETAKAGPQDETRVDLLKMQAYEKKRDPKQVEELLKKVISLNPDKPVYQALMVQFLVNQRRFDEAEKILRERVAANKADTQAGLDLVRFLSTVRGPDAARSELENRIKSAGNVFAYQMALAELDFAQNKFDAATQTLKTLAASAPSSEDKIAAQAKLAEMYVAKANLAAAEPLIADILSKDRRNATALRLRAGISVEKGQFDSAIADLREALNDQPKAPDLLVALAFAYERSGKNELADRQFADAVKSTNSNPAIVIRYVDFLQRRSDLGRAEDILTEAIGRNPNNSQLLSALAQVRLLRKDWAGATTVADTLAKLNGGAVTADEVRAAALAGQNKIDESIAALEDAQRAAPNAVQPFVALVGAYLKNGQADKANALLKDTAQKYPDNARVLVLMGQADLAQNREADAEQNFKNAIDKQPKDPQGYVALSELYMRQKRYDLAQDVLQAALKEFPNDLNFRQSLAGLSILKSDYDSAIEQYEAILKDAPRSVVSINNLASLLLDNRTDKTSFEKALSLSQGLKGSNLPSFQDTLGWAEYKNGDYKNAVSTLEDVVAKAPNLAAARYHLGMSYVAAGQTDKAMEQFKAALSLEPEGSPLRDKIQAAMK